ncbi:MAG: urease accessory protein UreF [Gammaproteobacteria bacterium]|nr:urease accessory protein UreF [Gammaproteobacteria bacterium]MCP5137390.1 urease accessory protein UreF [Gammaproteobacteria bacterium]
MTTDPLARLRLLQLVSPTLPIGAFAYSQGLEWAVEAGWVKDEAATRDWLAGLIADGLAHLDLPILARMLAACELGDELALRRWAAYLLAARETAELRGEESVRARALTTLLRDLDVAKAVAWRDTLHLAQAAGFACAADAWAIAPRDALLGYAWSWLENQIAAAIKLVPLGQTAGQRVLLTLAAELVRAVDVAMLLGDDEIGASAPALAIASCRHETQYTRLFRS